MISAPGGSGRVTAFLKRLPTVLPFTKRKPIVRGEPVGHVQPDRLAAINETLDARSSNPCLPRQGLVAVPALGDCSPQNLGQALGRLADAHGA